MHFPGSSKSHRRHIRILIGTAALAGTVLTGSTLAAAPTKPTSSCVACHTDAEMLKAEAALVPVPAASALQAGKG